MKNLATKNGIWYGMVVETRHALSKNLAETV